MFGNQKEIQVKEYILQIFHVFIPSFQLPYGGMAMWPVVADVLCGKEMNARSSTEAFLSPVLRRLHVTCGTALCLGISKSPSIE